MHHKRLQMRQNSPQVTHARHKLPAPLLLGQAKVSHLETGNSPVIGVELAIQQQVVGLQIKVNHTHFMEVGEAMHSAEGHLGAAPQIQPALSPVDKDEG